MCKSIYLSIHFKIVLYGAVSGGWATGEGKAFSLSLRSTWISDSKSPYIGQNAEIPTLWTNPDICVWANYAQLGTYQNIPVHQFRSAASSTVHSPSRSHTQFVLDFGAFADFSLHFSLFCWFTHSGGCGSTVNDFWEIESISRFLKLLVPCEGIDLPVIPFCEDSKKWRFQNPRSQSQPNISLVYFNLNLDS